MQRLSMNPGGLTSEEAKQLEEEEAAMTKWNMISSVVAFGAIVLVLRVGKQNSRQIGLSVVSSQGLPLSLSKLPAIAMGDPDL